MSHLRIALAIVLLVCIGAFVPVRANAQAAAREAGAQTPAASSDATRAPPDAASEAAPDTPPASASSPRPAAGSAREAVATTPAVVEQPRAIGYFVGDEITQRVLLEREGRPVAPVALPSPGRVSAWFERRAVSVETDASSHRWLVIQYQILNAPPKLITVKLPAWTLAIKGDAGRTRPALQIPEALVNVAPLSPPGTPAQVGGADLRVDRPPPTTPTAPIRRAMAMAAGAFVVTLVAWLAWVVWRNRRSKATQPFARALREMRAFDDREPRAWQALHRAFDRTAGRVIQGATLPTLFERAPQLLPARSEIEQFFAQSSLLFFGASPAASGVAPAPGAALTTGVAPAPGAALAPDAASTRPASTTPRAAPAVEPVHGAASARPAPTTPLAAPAGGPSPRELCVELRRIEKLHER